MKKLRIADDLALPLEIVTEKLAMIGRTGSGKSYAATKLAELMLDAGAQIIALDPVGVWYGLRIGTSWNVYIFGGLHADFPLEAGSGALIADLLVDRGISAVLDVSQFMSGEQVRFVTDFANRFFHRKKAAPSAVHLFLEECQEFVPQNLSGTDKQGAFMLHAFERLWKLGRNFGIGGTLISQRPQEVNKKALNQAGTLFVFNMTGPQERKAIESWVSDKGISEDIGSVLPKLRIGEPHVWSPTFLGVSKTIWILPKQSADVSVTPKVGARATERPLTPVDVEKFKTEMAGTIERTKADDPKELKKQILALKQEILALKQAKPDVKQVEIPVLTEADRQILNKAFDFWQTVSNSIQHLELLASEERDALNRILQAQSRQPARPTPIPAEKVGYKITEKRQSSRQPIQSAGSSLGNSGLRRMMIALAQCPNGLNKKQVGIRAGLSSSSGSFGTYLAKGRTSGWIVGDQNRLQITQDGVNALGDFDPLPTGRELLQYWLNDLGNSGASRILQALANAWPKTLSRNDVGELTGLSAQSGSFGTYLSRLRTLELVTGGGDALKASDDLFD